MKVYVLYAKENWITDELAKEWIQHNSELYTTNLLEADTIWVLSNYIIHQIPHTILLEKQVIITIHHIVPWKMNESKRAHYHYLDEVADYFHSICSKTTNELVKHITKPIKTISLWHNETIFKPLSNKKELRQKYNLDETQYLIGSFQRDTEGHSITTKTYLPKLEKGPDIFVQAVLTLQQQYPKLSVVLTGYHRHYIQRELTKHNIHYYYFEQCNLFQLNELYNCLDLYIVGSRIEGGPRAINECSLTKTPLFSTKVGISELLCHPDSLFDGTHIDSILTCHTDIEYNYQQAIKYTIRNYMKQFTTQVF